MEVRSYYATTVEAAMRLARKELGPDAMLIQSQPTPPELAHMGRYEVVFAGELQARPQPRTAAPKTPEPAPPKAQTTFTPRKMSSAGLPTGRNRMEVVPELGPIDLVSNKLAPDADQRDFASLLASAGVDRESSRTFFDGAPKARDTESLRDQTDESASSAGKMGSADSDALARSIACSPGLGRPGVSKATVALAGPPGAGKTATIMKLAIRFGLAASRRVRLLAVDPQRVCATSQLRSFASLLSLPFEEVDSFEDAEVVLNRAFSGLTFLDTPGYSRSESVELAELATFLKSRREVETHLALRADRKTTDNLITVERYSSCGPKRLIFTSVDETSDHSELPAILEASNLPLSYLGTGPRIPEDIESALPNRVASLILNGWSNLARAAA